MRRSGIFLALISFTASAVAETSLRPWFYVKPGKLEVGGCDDYYDKKMQVAYKEVIEIASNANGVLDELLKAQPDLDKDYDGHKRWSKAAASLDDLFDIGVSANDAPNQKTEVKDAIEAMKRVYDSIASHAADTHPPSNQQLRKKFFCGDKFTTYVKDGDKNPLGQAPPGGGKNWWVDPGKNDQGIKPFWQAHTPDDPNKPDHPWCDEKPKDPNAEPDSDEQFDLNAATNQQENYVYFCQRALDNKDVTLGPQDKTMEADPDRETAQKNRGRDGKGVSLNDVRSLSRTMLHELVHLYNPIPDLPRPKMDKNGMVKENGKCVPDDGKNSKGVVQKIYGYTWVYGAAQCFPFNSAGQDIEDKYRNLGTVDSYVMFALSMFFKRYEFAGSLGRAVTLPPKT